MCNAAPKLIDYLGDASRAHYESWKTMIAAVGINFVENPRLVRGLDYYNLSVFEWVTTELGAQGTICAGGRYDGLIEQLGGKATPGIGFGMVKRLISSRSVPMRLLLANRYTKPCQAGMNRPLGLSTTKICRIMRVPI